MAEIKTRPIGKALFGVNFEPTGQAPLDARLVVENMETLLANETYVDRGNNFYEGMPVIVKQGKSGKSELWVLIDGTKVTDKAGWRRLDADGAAINVNIEKAIENAINNLNKEDTEEEGKFVTKVAESSGIITVTRQTVAADKVTATAITASDTTVAVAGNNVADQIASLGTTLKTVESNAAKYKVVKLSAKEVSDLGDANVKEAYKVVSYVGDDIAHATPVGDTIKIYKDANLESAELGTDEDAQKLILTYILADGSKNVVKIDFAAIAFNAEFKDGLAVAPNGEISVKRDTASESFLTVSADGVKLAGVQDAINAAVAAKNVTADGDDYITATADGNNVSVKADVQPLTVTYSAVGSTITGTALSLVDGAEVAKKVSTFTNTRISEEIAKLDVPTIGEDGKFITRVSESDGRIMAGYAQVKANEVKLEQIGEVDANGIKLNATTVQEGIAELFTKILDNEEVDAAAINKIKTILGITGEELKYEAKSDDTIIGAATSYSDADVKLAEAIRTAQDNAITIQAGNGVNITSNGSEKTINVKVVNDDKLITVDNSGIHTKDNAVFDCGKY